MQFGNENFKLKCPFGEPIHKRIGIINKAKNQNIKRE